MIGWGLGLLAVLLGLAYWLFIVAEGTYLGPNVVAWTYDLVADRYDQIKRFVFREESWFVAGPLLHAIDGVDSPVLLDVATGTGRVPSTLLRLAFDGHIVGLDLSKGMLARARAKLEPYGNQVSLVRQDASRLPFASDSCDAVTCLESLEFMPHPLGVLAEMVRVLAPGGVLMVTNRVGWEARFLPGRTLSRPAFERTLESFPLEEIDVRRWQVQYDLVLARKKGQVPPVSICPERDWAESGEWVHTGLAQGKEAGAS